MNTLKLSLVLILTAYIVGCSSASTKTSEYCDANWQGRYNTWQECYDRQLENHRSIVGKFFKGFNEGMKNSASSSTSKSTNCLTQYDTLLNQATTTCN